LEDSEEKHPVATHFYWGTLSFDNQRWLGSTPQLNGGISSTFFGSTGRMEMQLVIRCVAQVVRVFVCCPNLFF